jgi:hypothetical protein
MDSDYPFGIFQLYFVLLAIMCFVFSMIKQEKGDLLIHDTT